MNVDIYFHGNPKGFICVPEDGGQNFFEYYYNAPRELAKEFRIEMRPYNGKMYFYYTLMRAVDVADINGRPNAYCAITLRTDEFYTDAQSLFDLLEIIFGSLIENKILVQKGNSVVYEVGDFPQGIDKDAYDLIFACKGLLSDSHCSKAPNLTSSDWIKINPLDCTPARINKALNMSSSISISPEYPLEREHGVKDRINKLSNDLTKSSSDNLQLRETNKNLKVQVEMLQTKVNEMERSSGNIVALKNENEELKNKCASIFEQVDSLRQYSRGGKRKEQSISNPIPKPVPPTPSPDGKSSWFTATLVSLLNTILIIILFFVMSCSGETKKKSVVAETPGHSSQSTPSNKYYSSSASSSSISSSHQYDNDNVNEIDKEEIPEDVPVLIGLPADGHVQLGVHYPLKINPEFINQGGYDANLFSWEFLDSSTGVRVTTPRSGPEFTFIPSAERIIRVLYDKTPILETIAYVE